MTFRGRGRGCAGYADGMQSNAKLGTGDRRLVRGGSRWPVGRRASASTSAGRSSVRATGIPRRKCSMRSTLDPLRPSLGTIYRHPQRFARCGLLREIDLRRQLWYDTKTGRHFHFYREDTKKLSDIPDEMAAEHRHPSAGGHAHRRDRRNGAGEEAVGRGRPPHTRRRSSSRRPSPLAPASTRTATKETVNGLFASAPTSKGNSNPEWCVQR